MARLLANTNLTRRVLGGVVGVNLALALAVSAGAVPRPGDNVHNTAATEVEELAAPAARQAGDVAQAAAPAPAAAPTPTTAAPATTVAKPKVTTPPTTKAPKAAPKAAASAPAVTTAPAAPAPVVAAVTKVARRVPTAAEVQGVIAELKKRVPILSFVSIAPTQIDQIGDQVCTAFDNGQSFAQVKSTGLSMIPATVSVPVGTDDWAVRKAVALYCPGHANKLV
jgi:hypothetical protein